MISNTNKIICWKQTINSRIYQDLYRKSFLEFICTTRLL